jgi:hypothetical protein
MMFNKDSIANLLQVTSNRVHKLVNAARGAFSGLGKPARLVVAAAAGLLILAVLFWVVDNVTLFLLAKSYVGEVAGVFDLNDHLRTALLLATFLVAAFFARHAWSFSRRRRVIGIAGLAAMLIGHSLLLWYGTRDRYFDASGNPIKCYILTRDGKVTYGEHYSIDPVTGRQCRAIKPEILERLKQYEAGKRPQRITIADPVFFDPRSGEPIVWYSITTDRIIEIFDLMGFNPDTGEELSPITRDVAAEWKRRVPKLISDPEEYIFFDRLTGEPRAWYWLSVDERYEFYDAPGFRPQTGDKLQIVTREVHAEWEKGLNKPNTEPKAPNRVQITKDTVFFDPVTGNPLLWYWRRDKADYEFFDGQGFHPQNGEPLKSFTKDAQTQYQHELAEQARHDPEPNPPPPQRGTSAARQCDDLAANPSDARKVGVGVAYGDLKPLAADAVAACEVAANQNPNELRFKYQLARSLELKGEGAARMKNRQRAFDIHQILVRAGYAAAFDNLGSLYLWDKKDLTAAVALFRKGTQLGDSDSMVTLAELIQSGQVMPANPAEYPLNLYKRAAELGNPNGARAAQEMQGQQGQQLQQQQMMMRFMGSILRNIH